MDDLYKEYILEHYRHPRNSGTLEQPDVSHEDDNPLCGDRIRMDLALDGGRIGAIRFSGRGCAISQASASMLTEQVGGMLLDEVLEIGKDDILENLGIAISAARLKCALLGWAVLRGAILKHNVGQNGHVALETGGRG